MIKKIRNWFLVRKLYREGKKANTQMFIAGNGEFYTRSQLENAYKLGYTDGKRDGLTIAREQAMKSVKEILWHQNQRKSQ